MINFNGQLFSEDTPIFVSSNRAFRYGDALFESIRVFEGEMPFFDRHWQRLSAGMAVLKFEMPTHFSSAFFQNEISKLTENQGNWRIRLTVFRSGGGLYTPERNVPEFLIETSPLNSSRFELNSTGLAIGVFDEIRLQSSNPPILQSSNPPILQSSNPSILQSSNPSILQSSNPPILQSFKSSNALPNVLAAIFKKEKNWDDCLLLNTAGRIACGNSSNVFLVKNGGLFTPPLSEGCVAGTMRSVVLDLCKKLKIKVLETSVSPGDLSQADEIFLTNAIQGIRWVKVVEGVAAALENETSERILAALQVEVAGFFEK